MREITGTYQHECGTIAAAFSDDDSLLLVDLWLDGCDLSDDGLRALCEVEGTTPTLVLATLRDSAVEAAVARDIAAQEAE